MPWIFICFAKGFIMGVDIFNNIYLYNMYIIRDGEIIEDTPITLGSRTGMPISDFYWIDKKIGDSGIFYFNDIVYYKYYSVACFILDHPHMARLYNSGNIIAYIDKKNTIFTTLKGILLSYKNSDITKKHNSLATLLDREIVNLEFFIGYSKELLDNNHINYCSDIVRDNILLDIVEALDNILSSDRLETLFLKDLEVLETFERYCISLMDNTKKMLICIEENRA